MGCSWWPVPTRGQRSPFLGAGLLEVTDQEFKLGLELEQEWNLVLLVLGSVLSLGLELKFSVLALYYIQDISELQTSTRLTLAMGLPRPASRG